MKLFKTTSLLLAVAAYSNFLFAQQTTNKLSLKQCIEKGIENNFQVQQANFQMQSAEINAKQARLNLLPNLNASANHGINQGRSIDPFTNSFINQQINYASYGAGSSVVLFNGLSLLNTVKQNNLAFEASKMDFQQAKDNLTISIILAYLQVMSNMDQLVQLRNQSDLSQKQVERLNVLNKQGAIQPSQLFDLKGQYANDQLSIINAQNALETAKINLCQLMNIPYDANIELERLDESFFEKYTDDTKKIYETALQQFAMVKAADLKQKSAQKAVLAAKGELYPTLSFSANVNSNYSSAAVNSVFVNETEFTSSDYVLINGTPSSVIKKQSNFNLEKIRYGTQLDNNLFATYNLNLRIPLFNGLQARNKVKLAKINFKTVEWNTQTTKTQLQQAIEQAFLNMNTALNRFTTLTQQVNDFKESFRAAEIRFNEGVGNSIDYLTAKNNLDRANINLIMSKYEYLLRIKVLDFYQGKQLW